MTAVVSLDSDRATGRRDRRAATVLCVAALVWAIGAALLFTVVATGTSVSVSSDASGRTTTVEERTTLVESEGPSILFVLATPAVVAGAALAAGLTRWGRPVRILLGAVLWLLCLVAILSIGVFLMPMAVAILVAGALTPPRRRDRHRRRDARRPPPGGAVVSGDW